MASTSNSTHGLPKLTLSFPSHSLLQALVHAASSTCHSFLLFLNNIIKISSISTLSTSTALLLHADEFSTLPVVCVHSIDPCFPLCLIMNYSLLCLAASCFYLDPYTTQVWHSSRSKCFQARSPFSSHLIWIPFKSRLDQSDCLFPRSTDHSMDTS